ncbi:MAG: nucleotidyltransferase family protein [Pyrinomonadaceae bacterium]
MSNDDLRWHRLSIRRHEINIVKTVEVFDKAGIDTILFKGWVAAQNYPNDRPRFFGDIDIAVSGQDFNKAKTLLAESIDFLALIDIHREFRHLDTVAWDLLFSRSEIVQIDNTKIRVLRPEDHLRILAVHWLNDGGEHKDRLWDIYFAVNNRPKDFNWKLCLDSVEPFRRRWVTTTIMLAHIYLGLDISDVPLTRDEKTIPNWLKKTIEKEWASDVRLRQLDTCYREPKVFLQQLRKRFPPNPIQATIETNSELDAKSRIPIQLKNIWIRSKSFAQRVLNRHKKRRKS